MKLNRILKDNTLIFALCTIIIFLFIAIFAPSIAPFNPNDCVGQPYKAPNTINILGTNDIGQDILSELIVGARFSLGVGIFSAVISIFIATFVGVISGYFGGAVEQILMRITDFFLVVPFLPLVILISSLLRGGFLSLSIVIGLTSWPETARIIRSQVISIRNKDYILNLKAMGAGDYYIIKTHIFRELSVMIFYKFIMRIKASILAESTLSFLGLSSSVTKSWGSILYYAQARNAFLTDAWVWWVIPPGICIAVLCFSFLIVAYSLESKINPKLKMES